MIYNLFKKTECKIQVMNENEIARIKSLFKAFENMPNKTSNCTI